MKPADIVARLDGVPAVQLAAPALLGRLQAMAAAGQLSTGVLLQLQPEIRKAEAALELHTQQVRKVRDRCKQLPASPGRQTPLGF